jgi:diacylglycerol kinase family enzyme
MQSQELELTGSLSIPLGTGRVIARLAEYPANFPNAADRVLNDVFS